MKSSFWRIFFTFFSLSLAVLFLARLILGPFLINNLFLLVFLSALISGLSAAAVHLIYLKPLQGLTASLTRITQGGFVDDKGFLRDDEIGDLIHRISEVSLEFRQAVAASNCEREEIRAVLSSMNDGVLLIGRDEKIIHMSAVVPHLLELRAGETIGRLYWEAVRHDELNSVIKEAVATGTALSRDIVIYNPQESFFNVQIAPVSGADGEMISFVIVMHDISALKKYERMRSEFVANVSHELKTPLTSIRGYAETLRAGALDDRQMAQRFVEIIDDQARRLENLVSDILSLARVESKEAEHGEWTLSIEDISSIVNECVADLQEPLRARGHELSVLFPEEPLLARVERREIEHVFLNLIDNAIKFTPHGGRIVVRAFREERSIRVDVEDNGIGIELEHIDRLFERFYRVDSSRSQEMGGTGLGLSIVKHIVQAHQGRLLVHSEPGKGSTFSVLLLAA